MKFIVSSQLLLVYLQIVGKAIATKNPISILDCFLFQLSNNKLTITGADTEIRLTTDIDVQEAIGSGKFAVIAKSLLDALRELPEQPVTFEINDVSLELFIYYENGKYNFMAQDGNEYPIHKPLKPEFCQLKIQAKELLAGISYTIFASGNDEIRPVMNGVFFDITPEYLVFVSSDGHKLVQLKSLGVIGNTVSSFILPKKQANLLKLILLKEDGEITICFDVNNAYFTLPHFMLVCRLIEGNYPNYNAVIPQESLYEITIHRLHFLNALRRVCIFADPANNLIQLQISTNRILISAKNIDYSTFAEEMATCNYEGDDIRIGFKGSYLIDILSNIVSEEIVLKLSDTSRACVIFPVENKPKEDLLMLLMPMMLNE